MCETAARRRRRRGGGAAAARYGCARMNIQQATHGNVLAHVRNPLLLFLLLLFLLKLVESCEIVILEVDIFCTLYEKII